MTSYALYILTAFAMVFVIEGLVYALFPDAVKRMMALVAVTDTHSLRAFGLGAVALGFLLVWIVHLF